MSFEGSDVGAGGGAGADDATAGATLSPAPDVASALAAMAGGSGAVPRAGTATAGFAVGDGGAVVQVAVTTTAPRSPTARSRRVIIRGAVTTLLAARLGPALAPVEHVAAAIATEVVP